MSDKTKAGDYLPFDRSLPYSLEAEQSVLGAVLLSPETMVQIADRLTPDCFYLPQHQAIYSILYSMYTMNRTIDPVTLLEELKQAGTFDEAGGKSYIMQLVQNVPSAANIESYAHIVEEKSHVRSLVLAAREIIGEALEGSTDAAMLIDSAEQRIYEIRKGRENTGLRHIREVIAGETLDRLNKMTNPETRKEYIGVPSGISAVDRITTGLNRSDLIILGARPGMGKTSMALNMARNVAVGARKTVCFFSLEMTRDQLVQRLISSEASIPSEKLRTGVMDGDEWSRVVQACEVLNGADIYLDETTGITVPEMKAKLRRLPKVDLVIIDYLGLMRSPKRSENRVQEVSEITRNLKVMAKELRVPVICCAQLSRGTETKGKSHRPALADLRESGSIEQDADIVLFLYREAYYSGEQEAPEEVNQNEAECIIAKNRHGSVGTVKLHWDGQFTRFTSQENFYEDPRG